MGMTKQEFVSKYINDMYKKKHAERKKENEALVFTLERSFTNNSSWRKEKYGYGYARR